MATKRSTLPTPTPDQLLDEAHRFRRTPTGGWTWKCAYCGQFASSATPAGTYVCSLHGGKRGICSGRSARDTKFTEGNAQGTGDAWSTPAGFYTRREPTESKRLVAEYGTAQVDADDTTRDMLHLRARVELLLAAETPVTDVTAEIQEDLNSLRVWMRQHAPPAEGWTVATLQSRHDHLGELTHIAEHLGRTLSDFLRQQERIERLHRQIIAAAKTRAETRLKNRSAREMAVFVTFLQRVMIVLRRVMPAAEFHALEKHVEREFVDVPEVRSSLWSAHPEQG